MKRLSLILILLITFTLCYPVNKAFSSQLPRYIGKEKKFRMYIYNPYDVYRYIGNYNYHGFIEFQGKSVIHSSSVTGASPAAASNDENEQITEVAIGNSDAWLWKISDSKNRLYLKPVADDANTNMTVKTNSGRIYNFELIARTASGPDDPNLIFAVKFVYPDDRDRNILEFPKTPVSDAPDMRDLSIYNFKYEYTGEPRIAPSKVFDDGKFTYFQFSNQNSELPAIFSVDSEGYESLVNFRASGDYIIVERVESQFTLRNGSEIVCVYNNNLINSGRIASPTAPGSSYSMSRAQNNSQSRANYASNRMPAFP